MWQKINAKKIAVGILGGAVLLGVSNYFFKNPLSTVVESFCPRLLSWLSTKIKNGASVMAAKWVVDKTSKTFLPKIAFVKNVVGTLVSNYLVPGMFASELSSIIITSFISGITGYVIPASVTWPLALGINYLIDPNQYGRQYVAPLLANQQFNTAAYAAATTVVVCQPMVSVAAHAAGTWLKPTVGRALKQTPRPLTWLSPAAYPASNKLTVAEMLVISHQILKNKPFK